MGILSDLRNNKPTIKDKMRINVRLRHKAVIKRTFINSTEQFLLDAVIVREKTFKWCAEHRGKTTTWARHTFYKALEKLDNYPKSVEYYL